MSANKGKGGKGGAKGGDKGAKGGDKGAKGKGGDKKTKDDKSKKPAEKPKAEKPAEKAPKEEDKKTEKPKEKTEKPKEKTEKPKEKTEKPKEKTEKPKEKTESTEKTEAEEPEKDTKSTEPAKPAAKKPAKKGEEIKKVYLGRPGNNVAIGIVGMPNIGKSTLFNLLSKQNVPAENYPFCTIDPSTARVPVPDPRFDKLVEAWKPASVVPAVLTVVDIAGLVKGAHEGKGLGNEFLSNISSVDAIFHLVRAFSDKNIEHVEGDVNPARDLEIISEELILKDLAMVNAKVEAMEKVVKRGLDKTKKYAYDVLLKVQKALQEKKDVRELPWDNNEIPVVNELLLLTAKPVVYLVNTSLKDFASGTNKWVKEIENWVAKRTPGAPVIVFSAKFESEWDSAPAAKRAELEEKKKLTSQLPKIITEGYHALNLVHFFTCGEDEVRAWTIQRGTSAPKAAGVIHTDFEKCFILAEQYAYDHFVEYGSEVEVRKAGKYLTQGKTYVVKDGDILFFKHSAGGGGGKGKKK